MSGTVHIGDVRAFDDGPITLRSDCRDCAMKVLEEAAEAVEAWKAHDRARDYGTDDPDAMQSTPDPAARDALASELADVVQAACNLAAACGIDMRSALDACEARNRARGRITAASIELIDCKMIANMPTDEERREVAAALREIAGNPDPDGDVWLGAIMDAVGGSMGMVRGYVKADSAKRLADLIDRPTCENIANDPCVFRCSRCGCWTDRLAYFDLPEDEAEALKAAVCEFTMTDPAKMLMTAPHTCVPRYCPTCGAEVAR